MTAPRRRLYPATAHEAARSAAQNELFAARRSLKMAQDSGDTAWINNAAIRETAALATLSRLDAK